MNDLSTKWTVETLHEHLTKLLAAKEERDAERFRSQKETTALALSAADRAVTKAEIAAEKRFEGVNEFRQTLADQQRTLMPRLEADLMIRSLSDRITSLEKHFTLKTGVSQGLNLGWTLLIASIGLIGTVFGLFALIKKVP